MKNAMIKAALICAVFCLGSMSMAQTTAGATEISVSGSLKNTSADQFDQTQISGTFTYNKFFTDRFSVGGTLSGNITDSDSSESGSVFYLGRTEYYFPDLIQDSDWVPYAGVSFGMASFTSGDTTETEFAFGGQVGAKTFIREDLSVNVELNTLTYTVGDETLNVTGIDVGISVYF